MIPRRIFLFYLIDSPTGNCYYLDSAGNIKTTSITAAGTNMDASLKQAPDGWMNSELGFIRNTTYMGINRSFSIPLKFVGDGAYIIRKLVYEGKGTEVPLTLAIYKYNDLPSTGEPSYKLYYKGVLDLPKINDISMEGVQVNLMEGGITQLLKAYENTVYEIPCDGSIKENLKYSLDGLLLEGSLYYSLPKVNYRFIPSDHQGVTPLKYVLAANFTAKNGDSVGIINNSQSSANAYFIAFNTFPSTNFDVNTSQNFLTSSSAATTVNIKGSLLVGPEGVDGVYTAGYFKISFVSNFRTAISSFPSKEIYSPRGLTNVNYNFSINLQPNENLFMLVSFCDRANADGNGDAIPLPFEIAGGSFTISTSTFAHQTRGWGLTMYDLGKLLVQSMCASAKTGFQTFDFDFDSQILLNNLNLIVTSGDALRASGDSSYQKFYNPLALIGENQNQFSSYGPVIKTSYKEWFEAASAILMGASSSEQLPGSKQALFFEGLGYVFDPNNNNISIGEVSDYSISFDQDYMLSNFKIGYKPQSYDQKAGKYEYNTTLEMQGPVKSFAKNIEKISPYRTDSYGIERVRSTVTEQTSTTHNDSDNSVFIINIDPSKYILDYFKAYFDSVTKDPANVANTNIHIPANIAVQPLNMPLTDGGYFQMNQDFGIMCISDEALFFTPFASNLTMTGIINSVDRPVGAPQDSFTVKLWLRGQVIYQQVIPVTGVDTPININYNFTESYAFNNVFYVTVSTTATCIAEITTFSFNIGTYFSCSSTDLIDIEAGVLIKVISPALQNPVSIPYTPGTSNVQYGYQYFIFNDIIYDPSFAVTLAINGYIKSATGADGAIVYVSVNGDIPDLYSIPPNAAGGAFAAQIQFNRKFVLGDIVFLRITTADATIQVQSATLQFDSNIKAYDLKRVNYDSLTGIPNIAIDASTGMANSSIQGSPYNIEDLTPKRLYGKWEAFINSCLYFQNPGKVSFQTLSKNAFLSTSLNGVTITENADEPLDPTNILFYPLKVRFKTKVPQTFAETLTMAANAHIHFTFCGLDFYGFPLQVKQRPALNETQEWELLLSPKTDLTNLSKINFDGINTFNMGDNSIAYSFLHSLQIVPEGQALAAKYHTRNRDQFWYNEQVGKWLNQKDYKQPVQIGDFIPLQFITRGLDPVMYNLYQCIDGVVTKLTNSPINLNTVVSPAIVAPYVLWEKQIDTSTWTEGVYCFEFIAGVGDIAAKLLDEPLCVKQDQPDTLLFEYSHSRNTQGAIFDTGYKGSFRVAGFYDNQFKQKYKGAFYVDQPQDIEILNAIPYEIAQLFIGAKDGIPDWVFRKVARVLLLNNCFIEGEAFSLNEGAEWEEIIIEGNPKKYGKIDIRPCKNQFGLSVNANGVDTDSSLIVTIDAQAMGPNADNLSGTSDPDIINIKLT